MIRKGDISPASPRVPARAGPAAAPKGRRATIGLGAPGAGRENRHETAGSAGARRTCARPVRVCESLPAADLRANARAGADRRQAPRAIDARRPSGGERDRRQAPPVKARPERGPGEGPLRLRHGHADARTMRRSEERPAGRRRGARLGPARGRRGSSLAFCAARAANSHAVSGIQTRHTDAAEADSTAAAPQREVAGVGDTRPAANRRLPRTATRASASGPPATAARRGTAAASPSRRPKRRGQGRRTGDGGRDRRQGEPSALAAKRRGDRS